MQQAGGSIWVYSEPGTGTTFKVYFPRVVKSHDKVTQSHRAGMPSGTETVLMVEDEEPARTLIAVVLKRIGYTPLAARNGTEPLHIFEEHRGPIHLVITDITMPEMSGPDLV